MFFEVYFVIFPPLLFFILLYVVRLAARFVRAWERIAEAMERSGHSQSVGPYHGTRS